MRILQISSARTYGGGERHVVDLCRGLQERGHEVFAALRPTSVWQDRLSFLPSDNILQVSIRNSIGIFSAKRIADFIKEKEIDIVHAHVARDYIPASIACMAAKPAGFVITRHVMFPLKPFNRFALKNVTRVIGVSDAVGQELTSTFPRHKIRVICNGIEISDGGDQDRTMTGREFRELHSIPDDALVVGTLGELRELKGQRDFVLAASEIVKEVPNAFFVIVGEDNTIDKKFRRELKRLVSVFGMTDQFLWLDWLEDTVPFYSAVDLFVSPSHSESFGLAILEAMAHGKAVVSTETDGAMQLLTNPRQRVPVNDAVKLARGCVDLLGRNAELLEIGAKARLLAAEKYSLRRMLDETEGLYREIAENARS